MLQTGGLGYDVPAGRKDGIISKASEASASLPPPTNNVNQLTQTFINKGLTQEEMVTLSGEPFQTVNLSYDRNRIQEARLSVYKAD